MRSLKIYIYNSFFYLPQGKRCSTSKSILDRWVFESFRIIHIAWCNARTDHKNREMIQDSSQIYGLAMLCFTHFQMWEDNAWGVSARSRTFDDEKVWKGMHLCSSHHKQDYARAEYLNGLTWKVYSNFWNNTKFISKLITLKKCKSTSFCRITFFN